MSHEKTIKICCYRRPFPLHIKKPFYIRLVALIASICTSERRLLRKELRAGHSSRLLFRVFHSSYTVN
jgi:hypothetical protein